MKLVTCLIIIAISTSNAFEVKRYKLISSVGRSIESDAIVPASTCSTAQKSSTFCSSNLSCEQNNILLTCHGNGKFSQKTCKNQKPYCVGSEGYSFCSSVPDVATCTPEYLPCLGNGLYPELDSCRSYYNCTLNTDKSEITAERFVCDKGFVFNPNKGCTRGLCIKPACPNNKNTMWRPLNYLGFDWNRLGLLCVAGNPTFMYSCPNNMQIDLDSTSEPKCILKCTLRTQIAPNLDDNTKYLKCVKGKIQVEECQAGLIFDPDQLRCVEPEISIFIDEVRIFQDSSTVTDELLKDLSEDSSSTTQLHINLSKGSQIDTQDLILV